MRRVSNRQFSNDTSKESSSRRECRIQNILYVSFTGRTEQPYLDPSTRYRCFYPAEAARALGHRAFVSSQAALYTVDPLLFDLIVVHRPAFTPEMVSFVQAARASGARLVADYDDLIFDPAYATASSMFAKSWNLTSVLATFERNTDALRLFQEFTVSTEPLQEHVLALHPTATVSVIPNSVPSTLWSMIEGRGYQSQYERPFVGYFPGTATHDEDFRVAARSLAKFCRDRRVPLRIVGPVQADAKLFTGVEVEQLPLQPFTQMFDSMAGCRVVVAPLTPTPFNRAKSHIKLLEAVLSCASCIASDIPDMAQHRGEIDSVSLVGEAGDWSTALEESWNRFDLNTATRTRMDVVQQFGSVKVYSRLFGKAA